MAKVTLTTSPKRRNHKKHPGVHSKNKTSNNKQSKMYRKRYRGQGR